MPDVLHYRRLKDASAAAVLTFIRQAYFQVTRLDHFFINTRFPTEAAFEQAKVGDLRWGVFQEEIRMNKRSCGRILSAYLDETSDINVAPSDILSALKDTNTNLQVSKELAAKATFDK